MYRDVLQPGDTFPMMRKMVVALCAIGGIFPMFIIIQKLMGQSGNNSSSYPRFVSMVIIMIGSWIYVKRTHTAPTWLIAFWINSLSVLTLLNMLTTPNAPYEFVLIGIMNAVLVCKVPSVNLTVPFMGLLVFCYNFSLGFSLGNVRRPLLAPDPAPRCRRTFFCKSKTKNFEHPQTLVPKLGRHSGSWQERVLFCSLPLVPQLPPRQ